MVKPKQAKRVLIIDDDRELMLAIALRLRAAGYDVITAQDGDRGLDAAAARRPDVIVLDLRMPGMDGWSTLTSLRASSATRSTPVVVLSACSAERSRVLDLGAAYYLEKPCNPKLLMSAIETSIAEGGARL
jgi:DNA-binding response OmpR family regulator